MNNIYKTLFSLAMILIFGGIYVYILRTKQPIVTTKSLRMVGALVSYADTLIVFDIDNVLTMCSDPWERKHKEERAQARTINTLYVPGSELDKQLDKETKNYLFSIHLQAYPEMLVDEDAPHIINRLHKDGAKIIALTDFPTGPLGTVPLLEQWRIDRLKSFNIDFSTSAPSHEPITFEQFTFDGMHPTFKDGILFTGARAASKGELLKAYLETIGWRPTQVIMVDDKIKNIESVQKAMMELGISGFGLEYTRADKLPAYFDKDIAEFQMQHLIDQHEWLSGEQVKGMRSMRQALTPPE